MHPRNSAAIAVVILALLMWLYVREFKVLSNTLEIKGLIIGSLLAMALLVGGLLWKWRNRFIPMDRHFPEVVMIVVFSLLFAPLFGSLLNRSLGTNTEKSFDFVSETAYFASGYGVLKGEKLSPTGWRLSVVDQGHTYRVKYKAQAYFPLTKPGEKILLPVRHGIFGVNIVQLR